MESTTKLYHINQGFAREHNLPRYFVARKIIETAKAVYLVGHGTLETTRFNECCVCGRALTHPVSVVLGIGPECGGHYWDWNTIGGYSEELMETLKIRIKDLKVDQWFPKYVLKGEFDTETVVDIPKDHPKLLRADLPTKNQKSATYITFQSSGAPGIKMVFDFDRDLMEKVKTLTGRRFVSEPSAKYWVAPVNPETLEKLVEWGFTLDSKLQDFLIRCRTKPEDKPQVKSVPGLKVKPYDYQITGIGYVDARNGSALIADEMGLGKTCQALGYLQLRPARRPAIVVCPSSLKLNWEKEAHMWMTNPDVQILSGTRPNVPIVGELIIINYDILKEWVDVLIAIRPQIVIFDEGHYIKNSSALRTKAAKKLARNCVNVLGLSGTPIESRPVEIYNLISMIDGTLFPSFFAFAKKYCGAKQGPFGWDFSGSTNTGELNELLSKTIMLRRLKKDVLKDLPDKTRAFVPMELDNMPEYKSAERDFIAFVRRQKGAEAAERASNAAALAEINGLKQIAAAGKIKQAITWIRDFLESGQKLVVMAVHKAVIEALMTEFKDIAVKVDGSVTGAARQKAVDEFQTNPAVQLFVGNIKAAGVGLTLTAASNVVILELPWTPGALQQAIDRVHRITQKNAVTAWFLLAAGTIEEKIALLLDAKQEIVTAVLDGADVPAESMLRQLMNEYTT